MTMDRVTSFLSDPIHYEDASAPPHICETHASQVFLTDHFAYKRKKSVKLPFLDYSSLDLRAQACAAELRVNEAFAPGMYLGLVYLVENAQAELTWGEAAQAQEVLVKMRRYRLEDQLDVRLARGPLQNEEETALCQHLCACLGATSQGDLLPAAYAFMVEEHVLENRRSLEQLATELGLDPDPWRLQTSRLLLYLKTRSRDFADRVRQGWVRLGHGDLKPEHLILQSPPVLMDAIEFNTSFRTLDLADELSFLELELTAEGHGPFGQRMRQRVLSGLGDSPIASLLAFYRIYRAHVRAKVLLFRAAQLEGGERETVLKQIQWYQRYAQKELDQLGAAPVFFIVGTMGSGKSTLARALHQCFGGIHLESDAVRRELYGASPQAYAFGAGIYSYEHRERVYRELLARTQAILDAGGIPLVDASFAEADFWKIFAEVIEQRRCPYRVLLCECSEALAKARVEQRRVQGHSLSEARSELLSQQRRGVSWAFPEDRVLRISTEQPMESILSQCLAAEGLALAEEGARAPQFLGDSNGPRLCRHSLCTKLDTLDLCTESR